MRGIGDKNEQTRHGCCLHNVENLVEGKYAITVQHGVASAVTDHRRVGGALSHAWKVREGTLDWSGIHQLPAGGR